MATKPEAWDRHGRSNSTTQSKAGYENLNHGLVSHGALPYRPKRRIDHLQPGTEADPAAKRVAHLPGSQLADNSTADSYRQLNVPPASRNELGRDITDSLGSIFDDTIGSEFDETLSLFSEVPIHASPLTNLASTPADLCSFENLDLFSENFDETPPSSVLRGLDVDSRFAEDFDPNLQYSSPEKSTTLTEASNDVPALEKEVNWGEVHEQARKHLKVTSQATSDNQRRQLISKSYPGLGIRPLSKSSCVPKLWVEKTLLNMRLDPDRTFFHLAELLETKSWHFNKGANVAFELFARVMHTSRENFVHKQYFQFRDLFKAQPPYLSGALLS